MLAQAPFFNFLNRGQGTEGRRENAAAKALSSYNNGAIPAPRRPPPREPEP